MTKVKGLAIALSFCCANALYADENSIKLDEVTVSSTNMYETDINDISKVVSVIDEEEIKTKSPTSIIEVMKDSAGVNFSRAGGLGGQLSMRGFNSNDLKIPMSINGERFRGRNTLEYNMIDPSRVEKIEIIRGPAAAIYGSEAMAGMVNIVTKKAKPNFSEEFTMKPIVQNVSYDSVNNGYGTRVEVEGSGQGIDMLLGAGYKTAEDYDTPKGKATHSEYETKHLDGSLGYSFDEDTRLGLNFKLSDTETHRAGGLGSAPGMYADLTKRVYISERPIKERYLGLTYETKPDIEGISKIDTSVYRRTLWTDVVTTTYPNATSTKEVHRYVQGPLMYGGKVVAISDPIKDTIFTAGADFYLQDWEGAEQEIKGTGTVASVARKKVESDSTQNNFGTFLLAEHLPNEWLILSANVRYDYYKTENDADVITIPALTQKIQENKSKTDDVVTYSLGTVIKPKDWLNFTANYSTAYRTPTVNELFGYGVYGSGYILPNPELKSEKSKTIDLSARLIFEDLLASATVYKSDYKDMISWENITYLGTTSRQRVNIGKATVEGLELDLKYAINNNYTLTWNGAYTKGTDTTTVDKPLKYIAPFVSNLGLRYDGDLYYVSGHAKYSKAKTRIDTAVERETDSYLVYDVYAGVELKKFLPEFNKTTIRLGVENIFNKAYVDATTYESITSYQSLSNPLLEPGRNFKISLTTRF
ncbi:MAG: TonB-dependent receptor [Arcobacteraceae bacterium]|nr:TonB-dependent receptor [Arcobacteraceae bacterium]